MPLSRRLVLLLPLVLSACGGDDEPMTFEPLRYNYLTPLRLNVADLEIGPAPPPGPLDSRAPEPLGPAARQMLVDRLSASGSSGRALASIDQASITRSGSELNGVLAIRVNVFDSSGKQAGFAEARVSRTTTGVSGNLRAPLYAMTKKMLEDMNVELEFQLRRSLRDYLQTTSTAPMPSPVVQQNLSAPAP